MDVVAPGTEAKKRILSSKDTEDVVDPMDNTC